MVCGLVATTSRAQKVSEAEALLRAKAFMNSRTSAPAGGRHFAPQSITSLSPEFCLGSLFVSYFLNTILSANCRK